MSKFVEIASAKAGKEYGHVPGHQYHDVKVSIGHRGSKFRVQVEESWGSCRGVNNLEEAGNSRIVAIDDDLDAAVRIASSRAKEAQIAAEYLVQALSCAHSDAVDALPEADKCSFIDPLFTPISGRQLELSVSAREEGNRIRFNLGHLTFYRDSFVFVPNNTSTGGEPAKKQVMVWVDERWNWLLDVLISRLDSDEHQVEIKHLSSLKRR